MKRLIGYWIRLVLFYLFRIFPVKSQKVCLVNFNGKGFGDNPKYIALELLKRCPAVDLVWLVTHPDSPAVRSSFPPGIRLVEYRSLHAVYEQVTARVWIDNCRKQPYVRKRLGQFYMQTWHDGGDIPLKKMEQDVESKLSAWYVAQAKNDSRLIDVVLSGSAAYSGFFRRAFWYEGGIWECGFPKSDILLRDDGAARAAVDAHFGISPDTHLVLYAPTFRNTFSLDVYALDCEGVLRSLEEKTGEKWLLLVRLHPNIAEKAGALTYNDKVLNASAYADMQELLAASDVLITDYSGIMFEFALIRKPVFLFIKDYETYGAERDCYRDVRALPFPLAADNADLIERILHFDPDAYAAALDELFSTVTIFEDGHVAERVAERLDAVIHK